MTRTVRTSTSPVLILGLLLPAAATAQIQPAYAWTGSPVMPASNEVMMTPIVIDLDGDGVPEILFTTFADHQTATSSDGILRAVSGADCSDVWTATALGTVVAADGASVALDDEYLVPTSGLAAADIDGDGRPEILGVHEGKTRVIAFEHDGTFKWLSAPVVNSSLGSTSHVSIADIDQDGVPEISCFDHMWNADGTLRWGFGTPPIGTDALIADIDLDGSMELVTSQYVFGANAQILWSSSPGGRVAIADFDLDGIPEILEHRSTLINLFDAAGQLLSSSPVVGPAAGRMAIVDVDGDSVPEVAYRSTDFVHLYRYEPNGQSLTAVWSSAALDPSSSSSVTACDLDGDGAIEILAAGMSELFVVDGLTGSNIATIPLTSGTSVERPVVADVDGDGDGEIVASANRFSNQPVGDVGITVFHEPGVTWGPARPIWNQFGFHQTNVHDDGTIPTVEAFSWQVYNNYAAQVRPAFGVQSSGAGCASQSTSLQPELANAPGTGPWRGTTMQLVATAMPSSGTLSPFAFLIVDLGNPELPLGLLGRADCTARAGLGGAILAAPTAANSATWSIAIANDPGLLGQQLFAQAAAFEFASTAGASLIDALSNGVVATVGGQ